MTSAISYQQFAQAMESSDSYECLSRMGYMSQMRRRGSNVSIYSQNSIASSVSSSNQKSTVVPSPIDLSASLIQKGFELRQFDSIEEFDTILDKGYGIGFETMPTLKLTLTPELLRN
jgi:4-hydroxyphenylpyruvate dioxygenase-like putative hemolysin